MWKEHRVFVSFVFSIKVQHLLDMKLLPEKRLQWLSNFTVSSNTAFLDRKRTNILNFNRCAECIA